MQKNEIHATNDNTSKQTAPRKQWTAPTVSVAKMENAQTNLSLNGYDGVLWS